MLEREPLLARLAQIVGVRRAAAEELGFDSIWTAEAYGSDVLTPLAWWGAATSQVRLGTAIMQMSARQPAAAAMAAMTMDHLSGGRFILGLGVSGPQVSEGWYGVPFAKPLARTREYLDTGTASWSMLTDPNTKFSPQAIQLIQSAMNGTGAAQGGIEGAQNLVTPVPEPATIAVWTFSALGAMLLVRRKAARAS